MQGLKQYKRDVAVALLTAMYEDDADFTNTFRALGSITTAGDDELPASLAEVRARMLYHCLLLRAAECPAGSICPCHFLVVNLFE